MKALFGMLLCALAACGGGSGESPGPASPSESPAMAKMQEFAADICRCSDNSCLQQTKREMDRWVRHQSKDSEADLTPEDAAALDKIEAQIDTCTNNIQTSR
jgi:hypothetical protein